MNKRKLLKNIISVVLTFVLVTLVVGSASALVIIPIKGPFDDISIFHWAVKDITWLKNNGITTGYSDNTFRPDNNVTRAEMAAFLHREAGALVAAGVHIERGPGDVPVIDRWFNNVNGTAPTIDGLNGYYEIDFKFDLSNKFYVCTIDTNAVATRDAICSVNFHSTNEIKVRVYDISEGGLRPGEFWVLVYGNDIQP